MSSTSPSNKGARATTRNDVARRARVSVATVSMALRGDPRIKEETAQLVKMVAKELNYRPRASASALAGGRTHTVGFVFAHPRFEERVLIGAYALLLERVGEILSARNYHLNLLVRSFIQDEQGGHRLPRMFHEAGIEGFFVVHKPNAELSEVFRTQNVPFVLLDAEPTGDQIAVYVDECRAAELAVEHLIELGHRRIANVSTLPRIDHDTISHRMVHFPRGYVRAMSHANLPAMPGWDEELPLYEHLEKLQAQPHPPTAFVTYDDQSAAHVIKWLAARNLHVPQDVSVLALHDTGMAHFDFLPMPSITCLDNMQESMATVAAETLLGVIERQGKKIESTCLRPNLIVRQSTGPVNASHKA